MTSDSLDELQLLTPARIDALDDRDSPLKMILDWARGYLANPHPDLGREGFVCPFVPTALERQTLWFAIPERDDEDVVGMEVLLERYREGFLALEPRQGKEAQFKAIVLLFPHISAADAPKLIDDVQARTKPRFVDDGLMIGQFHEENKTPSLHGGSLYPLQSPIPLLAIRFMVVSDLPFLTQKSDPPERRLRFIRGYLKAYQQTMGVGPENRMRLCAAELERLCEELLGA